MNEKNGIFLLGDENTSLRKTIKEADKILSMEAGVINELDDQEKILQKTSGTASTILGNFKIITDDKPVKIVPWWICTGLYSCAFISLIQIELRCVL